MRIKNAVALFKQNFILSPLKECAYTALLIIGVSSISIAQNYQGPKEDIDAILKQAKAFSLAVVNYDTTALGEFYTEDAKIFPTGSDIISGRAPIRHRWSNSKNIISHELIPLEIKIYDNEAYDYGYFKGTSTNKEGNESSWSGKYLVIWRKEKGVWRMYLDIWNAGGPD